MRTGAKSSGIRAAEISPYIVRDSKILLCQGRAAMSIRSSLGLDTVVTSSSRTEGPPSTIEPETGFVKELLSVVGRLRSISLDIAIEILKNVVFGWLKCGFEIRILAGLILCGGLYHLCLIE
jgi:hypothetical protein